MCHAAICCYCGPIKSHSFHFFSFNSTQGHYCTMNADIISIPFSETIIYRVSPSASSPTLLATPNWPLGMKPFSTVSWIVTVPSQYKADMQFVNVNQPKCEDRHTSITVKMLHKEEEIMSRREDQDAENLTVSSSYYLNMSNCRPDERHFGVMTKIVLQKKTRKFRPFMHSTLKKIMK